MLDTLLLPYTDIPSVTSGVGSASPGRAEGRSRSSELAVGRRNVDVALLPALVLPVDCLRETPTRSLSLSLSRDRDLSLSLSLSLVLSLILSAPTCENVRR